MVMHRLDQIIAKARNDKEMVWHITFYISCASRIRALERETARQARRAVACSVHLARV